jgi:hypothetical protein
VPVTAKLSRQFYERLGDEVANELVDWFNAVDASYRQEFKDLFEANFGQVRAELRAMRSEFDSRMEVFRAELDAFRSQMLGRMAALETKLTRRMLYFWLATVGTILTFMRLWMVRP